MINKKVLLIRPPSQSSFDFSGHLKKSFKGHELELGLLYIASYLEEKGIDVKFLDMTLNTQLLEIVRYYKPHYIGITSYTNTIGKANEIAGIIKQYAKCPIIIGGAHASALPTETLETYRNFDYLIFGEGEKTITNLILGQHTKGLVERKNDTIFQWQPQDPIDNLDELPFPARHLLDIKKYIPITGNYYKLPTTGIISGRGCPYQCTFCSRVGTRFRNRVRFRSIENVIAEIEFCIKEYGIRDFRFYDDTFTVSRNRVLEFCRKLIKENIKITWNCYARVDTVDKEILLLMKKAGCYHIKYGVEFGTQKWLDKTKKGTTLEQAQKAIRDTKHAGLSVKSSFMIGMPDETKSEILETIKFAKQLNSTYSTFGIFTMLPGSELYTTPNLPQQLPIGILIKLIKQAYQRVYLNPKFILHRIWHLLRNFSIYEFKALVNGLKMFIKQ